MLAGIDPLLSGVLLKHLDELGHGETIAVVDGNFAAYRTGMPVVRIDSGLPRAVQAVVSVLPLEAERPVARMQVDGDAALILPHIVSVLPIVAAAACAEVDWEPLPRAEFYARAAEASLVLLTRELEPYANVILTKGVVTAPPEPLKGGRS